MGQRLEPFANRRCTMGWRDEALKRGNPEVCVNGKCTCHPLCEAQLARVNEFLTHNRVPPKTLPIQLPTVVKGHKWLCAACSNEQPGPGAHCGYRIILVEEKGLEYDSHGRIVKATAAQQLSLYGQKR